MARRADDERLAPHSGHEGGPRGLARSWFPELPERVTAPSDTFPRTAFATTGGLNVPWGPKTAALSTWITEPGGVKAEVTVAETVTVLVDRSLIEFT